MNFDDDADWIAIPYTALEQRLQRARGQRARARCRRPPTHLPTIRRPRTKAAWVWWSRDPR